MFAAGLTIPAIVSVAALLDVSAQDAPLKVIVTTPLDADAVAVQLVNALPRAIVGVAGTVNAEGSVTVMVLPDASAPVDEVVKPTVHVDVAWATVEPGVKETAETEVAVIVIAELGLTAVASCEVATLNPLAG